jgi:hypothetical protein
LVRVLLLQKEEKGNFLITKYFPSFSGRGVMPVRVPPKLQRRRKRHDGVVKMSFETASFVLIGHLHKK